ncbi:MAG: hypothetical protein M3N28_07305 [Actinomycetota bacterium]|nr:hypothetical protein [Actinomycetota bacterium]
MDPDPDPDPWARADTETAVHIERESRDLDARAAEWERQTHVGRRGGSGRRRVRKQPEGYRAEEPATDGQSEGPPPAGSGADAGQAGSEAGRGVVRRRRRRGP